VLLSYLKLDTKAYPKPSRRNAAIGCASLLAQMSDIARKSAETFGFKVLYQGVNALTGILLARVLGPYGKGIFAYVASALAVLLALNSGQGAAISWQYGRLKRPSAEVLHAMLRVLLFGGAPLALIVTVIALTVPDQVHLLAVALIVPFAFFIQMTLAFYLADGNVRVFNMQMIITSVVFLVGLVPSLLLFHLGITAVLVCWVFSYVVTAFYVMVNLKPYYARSRGNTSLYREQLTFGFKASANAVASLLNYQIDIFIIRFVLGAAALGVYSIAIAAGEFILQLNGPLRQSAFGRINSGSRSESANLTAKCVRHTLAGSCLACIVAFFLIPPLIPLVYGKAFEGGGTALRFLTPGIAAYSVLPFFSVFFTQQLGRPLQQLLILSGSALLCAVITFATVKSLGIAGGAIATSLSNVAALVTSVILFRRETGMSLKTLFGFTRDDLRPYKNLINSFLHRAWSFGSGRRA
jgi:O-antigen/teichoic acid export membrane protein